MTYILKENKVKEYFQKINLEASSSEEEFWTFLKEHHEELAKQFEKTLTIREEKPDSSNIYNVKNNNLDFGLDVAKRLADFYKEYCTWFASMEEPPPNRILDIGCDNGIITCFYAFLYPETEIIGIDKSRSGVACATQLAERLELSNVSFIELDYNDLNKHFSSNTFDIITTVRTLHEVMGTIPYPIYWSLKDYLEKYPVKADYRYIKVIERLLKDDGRYISAERLENPAAVGQWSNLLNLADLSIDWGKSGFIEFHETGSNHKAPIMVSRRVDSNVVEVDVMDGLKQLYARDMDLITESIGTYQSVTAELLFERILDKNFQNGLLLDFNQNWYKMRFEVWTTSNHILVYGYGNMGYRKLEVLPLDSMKKAEEKVIEFLSPYRQHGEVTGYSTLETRDDLSEL
jgi:SAM-dependent methyltransferase